MRATLSPSIDLRQLRYFLAVMDELHFGRAAERMHMSQPPLSQAIRKLEMQLGVQLLERSSRAVLPTNAGRAFAAEARKVMALYEGAINAARYAGGLPSALRIGCVPYVPMGAIREFVEAVSRRVHGFHPEVTHLMTDQQVAGLASGNLDIAIFCEVAEHPGVTTTPLFPGGPLLGHVAADHPLAAKDVVTPQDVVGELLLMPPRSANPAFNDRILAIAEAGGFRFAGIRESGGATPRDIMVPIAGGAGVALEPASFAEVGQAGELVVQRPTDPQLDMPDTVAAWRDEPPHHLVPVIAVVQEVARDLYQRPGT
jgi:DNA-binding transcriptional LysR family regulator